MAHRFSDAVVSFGVCSCDTLTFRMARLEESHSRSEPQTSPKRPLWSRPRWLRTYEDARVSSDATAAFVMIC